MVIVTNVQYQGSLSCKLSFLLTKYIWLRSMSSTSWDAIPSCDFCFKKSVSITTRPQYFCWGLVTRINKINLHAYMYNSMVKTFIETSVNLWMGKPSLNSICNKTNCTTVQTFQPLILWIIPLNAPFLFQWLKVRSQGHIFPKSWSPEQAFSTFSGNLLIACYLIQYFFHFLFKGIRIQDFFSLIFQFLKMKQILVNFSSQGPVSQKGTIHLKFHLWCKVLLKSHVRQCNS